MDSRFWGLNDECGIGSIKGHNMNANPGTTLRVTFVHQQVCRNAGEHLCLTKSHECGLDKILVLADTLKVISAIKAHEFGSDKILIFSGHIEGH